MSLNGRWPELLRSCAGSHQVGVHETLIDGHQKLYQRLPPQNLHLNIVCVVIVERATGCEVFCSQDVIITLTFFQGSSLREATNLEQSHSRVVAQEKGPSSKHGEEESQAVKQSCHRLETGNLSCHFLRKGWLCCALSVAVAICSKPVCHHDFKMYDWYVLPKTDVR